MIEVTSQANNGQAGASKPGIDLRVDHDQHRGLVETVLSQVAGITREDAEDAVQEAWIVVAEKSNRLEPGPIGGYLMRTARFKAMKIRDKRRGSTSLDELTELAGDSVAALADPRYASLDSHIELAELADDPIAARSLDAARKGASARVAPRGMSHQCARYTDEQVERVRALRAEGHTYRRIAELTGVPAGYAPALVRRKSRVTETTEGWTCELVCEAIRRFHGRRGRVPRYRDLEREITMPSPNTTRRLFGSWRRAVQAAGLRSAYEGRRVRAWTREEMVTALCAWRVRHGRWPGRRDMVEDPGLPSPATTRRHLGTQSPKRLAREVLGLLA